MRRKEDFNDDSLVFAFWGGGSAVFWGRESLENNEFGDGSCFMRWLFRFPCLSEK
jgi:hypothetical protein